jgi:Undecaprenyl-phosphate glucose phosphotransferase
VLQRHRHNYSGYLLQICDAGVIAGAWLGTHWIYQLIEPFSTSIPRLELSSASTMAPLVGVLWVAVLGFCRVYESRRMLGTVAELQVIAKAHCVAFLALLVASLRTQQSADAHVFLPCFAVTGGVALLAFRLALRGALRSLRARGVNLRHILAVGEGATMESLIARFDEYPELGLRVVGVVTDDGSYVNQVGGVSVIGHFRDISDCIMRTCVDEVLISLPPEQTPKLDRLLGLLKDETLDIRLVPDVHRYITLGCRVDEFEGTPIVRINDSPLVGLGAFAKRTTDVVLSALALVVLSPLLFLIGLLVKLDSPGPIIYAQERLGLNGRCFRMLKFRSMRADAESKTGAVWCQPSDDRRTAFGAFLRKTSLDELPQLWNVLCGDMSLVGPRPERPVFVDQFRKEIPNYMLRHKVHAGITGWAQVNGWRGNTSLNARIECDLFYIRNWSYLLDLKILLLTIWKGFVNKNAY